MYIEASTFNTYNITHVRSDVPNDHFDSLSNWAGNHNMGGLIKKLSMLIIRCKWKLNSSIGADFYTYAQIHIAPETLKMEGP